MKKKIKIILVIILIFLIMIGGYFSINAYMSNAEEKNFNETIKNISDIENESDVYLDKETNVSSIKASELSNIWNHVANDSKVENEMLMNLSNSTSNETIKGYIDLQVERTDLEIKAWQEEIKLCNDYVAFGRGDASSSQVVEHSDNIKDYVSDVRDKKIESERYLNDNPDLKKRLSDLNIDEDFLVYQVENSTTPTILSD